MIVMKTNSRAMRLIFRLFVVLSCLAITAVANIVTSLSALLAPHVSGLGSFQQQSQLPQSQSHFLRQPGTYYGFSGGVRSFSPREASKSQLFCVSKGREPNKPIDSVLSATLQSNYQESSYDDLRLQLELHNDLSPMGQRSLYDKSQPRLNYAPWQKTKENMKAAISLYNAGGNADNFVKDPIVSTYTDNLRGKEIVDEITNTAPPTPSATAPTQTRKTYAPWQKSKDMMRAKMDSVNRDKEEVSSSEQETIELKSRYDKPIPTNVVNVDDAQVSSQKEVPAQSRVSYAPWQRSSQSMKAKMSSNPDIPNEVIEMIDEPPSSDVVEPLQKANEEIVSANTRMKYAPWQKSREVKQSDSYGGSKSMSSLDPLENSNSDNKQENTITKLDTKLESSVGSLSSPTETAVAATINDRHHSSISEAKKQIDVSAMHTTQIENPSAVAEDDKHDIVTSAAVESSKIDRPSGDVPDLSTNATISALVLGTAEALFRDFARSVLPEYDDNDPIDKYITLMGFTLSKLLDVTVWTLETMVKISKTQPKKVSNNTMEGKLDILSSGQLEGQILPNGDEIETSSVSSMVMTSTVDAVASVSDVLDVSRISADSSLSVTEEIIESSDSQSMLSHFVFVERDADDLNSNYIPSANIVKNEAAEDEILQRNRERPHTLSSTTVMDSEEPPSKIPSHAVMATQSDTEVDESEDTQVDPWKRFESIVQDLKDGKQVPWNDIITKEILSPKNIQKGVELIKLPSLEDKSLISKFSANIEQVPFVKDLFRNVLNAQQLASPVTTPEEEEAYDELEDEETIEIESSSEVSKNQNLIDDTKQFFNKFVGSVTEGGQFSWENFVAGKDPIVYPRPVAAKPKPTPINRSNKIRSQSSLRTKNEVKNSVRTVQQDSTSDVKPVNEPKKLDIRKDFVPSIPSISIPDPLSSLSSLLKVEKPDIPSIQLDPVVVNDISEKALTAVAASTNEILDFTAWSFNNIRHILDGSLVRINSPNVEKSSSTLQTKKINRNPFKSPALPIVNVPFEATTPASASTCMPHLLLQEVLAFPDVVKGKWKIDLLRSNIQIDPFNVELSPDTLISASSSELKGIKWQIITKDIYEYHLELAFSTSSGGVYIFSGNLIGDRIVGSVYYGTSTKDLASEEGTDMDSLVVMKGGDNSWLNKMFIPAKYIGTFQMKRPE